MKRGIDYIGIGVGAMIFNSRGELLMMKRGPACVNERDCWEIPGGSVDYGETLEAAIIREVKEELGVNIKVLQQLQAFDHLIPNEDQHWVAVPFLSELLPGEQPCIMEPEKCPEIGWFALTKLPSPLALTTEPNLKVYHLHRHSRG